MSDCESFRTASTAVHDIAAEVVVSDKATSVASDDDTKCTLEEVAKRGRNLLVVHQTGTLGAARTITQAILMAQSGDAIAVCPGTYIEPAIVVDRNVEICGVGEGPAAVTICGEPSTSGEYTLTVALGCTCTIRNVTIRNTNADASCVLTKGDASITLERCSLTAGGGTAIVCEGKSTVCIRRSTLKENTWGVVAMSKSHVTMENCEVLQSKHDGVAASGKATLHLLNNTFRDCYRHGVFVNGTVKATLDRNTFEGNKGCALLVDSGCKVSVESNRTIGTNTVMFR
eukprot:PhF_6_TR6838/c0_g1_i1/m.9850